MLGRHSCPPYPIASGLIDHPSEQPVCGSRPQVCAIRFQDREAGFRNELAGPLVCDSRRPRKNAAATLLNATGKLIYDVTGPASVTHEELASILSHVSGKSIQSVNVTADEVEKGVVAAGIPQFAARSVRELDEEASYGYQAMVTPTVTNLTGRSPMSVSDLLQVPVPALVA